MKAPSFECDFEDVQAVPVRLPTAVTGSNPDCASHNPNVIVYPKGKESAPTAMLHSLGEGITAADLCGNPPETPPEIIAGVLYKAGTMLLSGPSKSRKTYTFLDLGLSVATGKEWLGFATSQTSVIFLNFELAQHSFHRRIAAICLAKGIKPPSNFHAFNLRAKRYGAGKLGLELPEIIQKFGAGLVILDPWYKLAKDAEENSNDQQAGILTDIEATVTGAGAALVIGHHFAKGNAGAKDSIDRHAGAGALARWADVVATLSELEESEAMALEMNLRDFAPVDKFAIRWKLPLWELASDLDPAKLKKAAGRQDQHPACELLAKLDPKGMTNAEWLKASGWSEGTYRRKRDELEAAGKAKYGMQLWKPC